jgi:hypothetical protein
VDVVRVWSLRVVCEQTSGVGSWTLLHACSFNYAYKKAKRPHIAANLRFDTTNAFDEEDSDGEPFWISMSRPTCLAPPPAFCEAPEKQVGDGGWKKLPVLPVDVPPLTPSDSDDDEESTPSPITGFQDIRIDYRSCGQWEVGIFLPQIFFYLKNIVKMNNEISRHFNDNVTLAV